HALARIAVQHRAVAVAAVIVGHFVAVGTGFQRIDGAAALDGLFLGLRAIRAALVVDAVADHAAGDGARRCRGDLAVTAADLAAQQGAGDTADHGAGLAALLLHRCLHVVGAAFLARGTDLLDARLHAGDAAEILETAA